MMKQLTCLLVALALSAFSFSPAEAAKKKKKNEVASGSVAGTLVSISKGTDTEATTLTVSVPGKKKKAPAEERKFELVKDAQLETLQISKKKFAVQNLAVDDLKEGERVVVHIKEGNRGQADRVLLVSAQKKKKKPA